MKKIIYIILGLLLIGAVIGGYFYNRIYNTSITNFDSTSQELFIPTEANYEDVLLLLESNNTINDVELFDKIAKLKKYDQLVKPGHYVISKDVNTNELINKLRIGDQTPMQLTFNNVRTRAQLAGKFAKYIESDSLAILEVLNDSKIHQKYGFDNYTFNTLFLPNTYEVKWTTTPEELIKRLANEYKTFWNDKRKRRASALGLSQSEVVILASIVKAETAKNDEAPKVAGLYLNRLKRKMLLQADPTLKFALGDFTIKRVLNKHKKIVSPYNTYMHVGLPPGPINIPAQVYIDAVLYPASHDYIFMCAKPDFSGYHNFAKTNAQHEAYAREYHRALNNQGIYR